MSALEQQLEQLTLQDNTRSLDELFGSCDLTDTFARNELYCHAIRTRSASLLLWLEQRKHMPTDGALFCAVETDQDQLFDHFLKLRYPNRTSIYSWWAIQQHMTTAAVSGSICAFKWIAEQSVVYERAVYARWNILYEGDTPHHFARDVARLAVRSGKVELCKYVHEKGWLERYENPVEGCPASVRDWLLATEALFKNSLLTTKRALCLRVLVTPAVS
jgi:hypothetical protein